MLFLPATIKTNSRREILAFLEELLITLMYSKKAQFTLVLGPIFFIGIMLIGHHMVSNLVFQGVMAPMTERLRSVVASRYEHAAWGALTTFWILAGKTLIKDRKKYLYSH